MKRVSLVKGIINYIFAMVFAIVFGLFLDANVGWFILLTLILAPLLSVFMAWLSGRLVQISCEMQDVLLSKGDICTMKVIVQNKSIFPTPPLAVFLTNEAGVRSAQREILASILPRGRKSFDVEFQAKICGSSIIGVETVKVTDYLGLFAFEIKHQDYESMQRRVAVIPDIAEISARDDNLLRVIQSSLNMDDGEDTVESNAYAFGGFPGYDNREYIPGDPLKRINWKQSAKRNKLLVRLDDEMAARAVNVVLDSVFEKEQVDIASVRKLFVYHNLEEGQILPKMAEDAIENALGMMQVLVRQNYAVNFYARMNGEFVLYEILDEVDLEAVRLELANYYFATGQDVERLPLGKEGFAEKVGLLSTPNSYENAAAMVEAAGLGMNTTIYAVVEEAVKSNPGDYSFSLEEKKRSKKKAVGIKQKMKDAPKNLLLPYLLSFLLSTIMFSVFDIPFLSWWTVVQALVCLLVVVYCELIYDHRIIGSLLTTLLVFGLIQNGARQAFGEGLLPYMHWFMSGGESVPNTTAYLTSILLIFTPFFAMVVYYFVRILYRTSFLMLVSLMPFVVYVKVMLDIHIAQVVFVAVLNVAAFLLHYRTHKDAGKRIVGYAEGLVSLGVYAAIFVLIGLALPESETKYYYMFENAFLGGNISEVVPEEYSEMSEYSGNADGFNELNDRKLYVVDFVEPGKNLYLNRQTFDLYDFNKDRWYPVEFYAEPIYKPTQWIEMKRGKNLYNLLDVMVTLQELEPELLDKYGLKRIERPTVKYSDMVKVYNIETTNFASTGYVTPPGTVNISVIEGNPDDALNTYVTHHGIFCRQDGFLKEDNTYSVEFFDEEKLREYFISVGGANLDMATSKQLLEEMKETLIAHNREELVETVEVYLNEINDAMLYQMFCEDNVKEIPEEIKALALEITKDCNYDWEKAVALQNYFRENDFVYDLEYRAPDDSVEYFLFEGKTGTCSDYASAYVLMARSIGLTVRYVEGFVPDEEYNGDYVVRTSGGHAYPEVYINNVGYVVIEATVPANYVARDNRNGVGFFMYLAYALLRLVIVFVAVSAVIVAILFLHLIATPFIKEKLFMHRVNKATPGQGIVLLYRRIQRKHTKSSMGETETDTPYEYASEFERIYELNVDELSLLVEKAAYMQEEVTEADKEKAVEIYLAVKEFLKQRKNQKIKK